MKKNVGPADRIVRLIIAAIFIAIFFTGVTDGKIGLLLIGLFVIFVFTSFISFCPVYLPFGFTTRKKKIADVHAKDK